MPPAGSALIPGSAAALRYGSSATAPAAAGRGGGPAAVLGAAGRRSAATPPGCAWSAPPAVPGHRRGPERAGRLQHHQAAAVW